MSKVSQGAKELALKEREECGDPRTKVQIKPRRVLECRNGKTRPLSSFPPHVVTINRFQVLLSSITCLSSCPTKREGICLTLPPPSIRASSNQQMTRKTPIPLLVPGYKSGLKTPVQCLFSLELARCSNSISHSNKLYSPLILPHFWKFFSNPHLVHDIFDGP